MMLILAAEPDGQMENRITAGQLKMEAEDYGNGCAQIVLASPRESVGSDWI
jgi:hypothetical protein